MTERASLGRGDELRLFFGIPIPGDAAAELERWARGALAGSDDLRIVPAAHLHVTLAFLGGRPAQELPALREALHDAAVGSQRPRLAVERYRETRSVAMLVLDDGDGHAAALQQRLAERLGRLGVYRREPRPWLPHVTVARLRERPGLHPRLPEPSPVSPSEAALYHSLLRRGGAHYEIVEAVALGG